MKLAGRLRGPGFKAAALLIPAVFLVPVVVGLARNFQWPLLLLLLFLFTILGAGSGLLVQTLGRSGVAAAALTFAVLLMPGALGGADAGYYVFYSALVCLLFLPLACFPHHGSRVRTPLALAILVCVALALLFSVYIATTGRRITGSRCSLSLGPTSTPHSAT